MHMNSREASLSAKHYTVAVCEYPLRSRKRKMAGTRLIPFLWKVLAFIISTISV